MAHRQNRGGLVGGVLLPMGLVCLFAFCSLALALLGGRAYRSVQQGVDMAHDPAVAAGYLRTKVNAGNRAGAISLSEQQGSQVLALRGEEGYETRIHFHEGTLWEAYVPTDAPFEQGAGTAIARLEGCALALDNGLFEARLTAGGVETRTAVALAEGGAA